MNTIINDDHPLLADLSKAKADQVAAMLAAGIRGWLKDADDWTLQTEARYDRDSKKHNATFSLFSNLGARYGLPEVEEPFFQIEVDRHTKKPNSLKDLPFAFGISKNVLDWPGIRDMAYPYLFTLTVLLRHRGLIPIGMYQESADRPLQIDLVGGQCIWRVMIWQNRLIREYNAVCKIDPTFHIAKDVLPNEPDFDCEEEPETQALCASGV